MSYSCVPSLAGSFFVRFEGNSFCPKMAKLDFLPWNSIFFPENSNFRHFCANGFFPQKIRYSREDKICSFLYLAALTYPSFKVKTKACIQKFLKLVWKVAILLSKVAKLDFRNVKFVFKTPKLVFKMPKLVFKTSKLPSPAFHWHVMGWISHKKKPES